VAPLVLGPCSVHSRNSPHRSALNVVKSTSDIIISIRDLHKTYATGFNALKGINLEIRRGEIFALLGPNGAGKTTLISTICGVVTPSSGTVTVDGFDIIKDYRATRSQIGLVPQELTVNMFEKVWTVVSFSRGLFGKPRNPERVEKTLKALSLWDKKDEPIRNLSGGMKRRVMIAKALAHEPSILFLDEPTAGVDVSLRREMWDLIRNLRKSGVTIILTTHYIEEAQEMADRIGVINHGEIIVVDEKESLMRKLGKKQLTLNLSKPLAAIPADLLNEQLALASDGRQIIYTFNARAESTGIADLIKRLGEYGIEFQDLQTKETSLEEIFVNLVESAS
jgi:ABC-2 type transport system ATP-binding protein